MTIHSTADLRSLSGLARRRFSVAHMSDTKWRKLFRALRETAPGFPMRVMFVDAVESRDFGMPWSVWLDPPRPYIDTAALGPVELRAIEWLEFPALIRVSRGRGLPDREVSQDLDATAAALARLGRFPVERTEAAPRVTGYSR